MANFFDSGETYRRAYDDQPLPMISYGLRFSEACAKELERLGSSRAYVLASRSLAKTSDSLEKLKQTLKGKDSWSPRWSWRSHTNIGMSGDNIRDQGA